MERRFSYRQAENLATAFKRHRVKYLFIGKSGAIILGFPDTTQDVDVFVEKSRGNCRRLARALEDMGYPLTAHDKEEILRGKDFIQIRSGPFDLDIVFAPDGIKSFSDAKKRSLLIQGLPVCHIDDIIKSKEAAGRIKDRESLPRLRAFRNWLMKKR